MCIRIARTRIVVALTGLAAVLAAVLATSSPAFAEGMTLQGVWLVTTQQRNCTTDAPMGAPHRALVSYHAGGTLSDTSAVPAFLVGQRSEGHGTWRHNGGQTYDVRWVAMIVFETAPGDPPGSPGFVPGWQVATNTVTLTGPDSFTSVGVSQFVNLNGDIYRVGCASRVAERFE